MTDHRQHPEYRALLAAVLAAPDDDLPRLVLADWIEERGGPNWAEFIRAQCELDRHPHADRILRDHVDAAGDRRTSSHAERADPDWRRAVAAAGRVRRAWAAAAAEITRGMPDQGRCVNPFSPASAEVYDTHLYEIGYWPGYYYHLRHGFIDWVRCGIGQWIGCGVAPLGPWVMARHPVRRVELRSLHRRRTATWSAYPDQDWIEARRDRIPWCLATRLRGFTRAVCPAGSPTPVLWEYPTPQASLDALHAAAMEWALAQPAAPPA